MDENGGGELMKSAHYGLHSSCFCPTTFLDHRARLRIDSQRSREAHVDVALDIIAYAQAHRRQHVHAEAEVRVHVDTPFRPPFHHEHWERRP